MSERPIIFSGPMVRAILEGRKTQTRRVFSGKGYAWWQACGAEIDCHGLPVGEDDMGDPCDGPRPYGVPGDTLYVKEKFACSDVCGHTAKLAYDADARCGHKTGGVFVPHGRILEASGYGWWASQPKACADTYGLKGYGGKWRSSRFMPRWASRIDLKVTGIRVERVRAITEEDCIAEGVAGELDFTPQMKYAELWNSINAKRGYSWESNPWVWVVEFEWQAGGAQ